MTDLRLASPQCNALQPVQVLHENPWFRVLDRAGYFTVEYRHRQVAILPVVEERGVVLVRPTRPILADCPLELPAGAVEDGESYTTAAARELVEETGIQIGDRRRLKQLPPFASSPNRQPMLIQVVQADVVVEEWEGRREHDDEITDVRLVSLSEVRDLICHGKMYVALGVAVISRFLLEVGKEGGRV